VTLATRKIVEIDRDLCDGCGLCTTACAEGALALDAEGKAVLVRDLYCDGMGVCLNVCPTGALTIVERDSAEYDAEAAREHVTRLRGAEAAAEVHAGSGVAAGVAAGAGPGAGSGAVDAGAGPVSPAGTAPGRAAAAGGAAAPAPSELTQWPVQLHLISPQAPYFRGADLLVAADCTAFTRGSFHADLLKGRKLVVACPKLDDVGPYVDKLAELIRVNELRSITVALMTVPCCGGLQRIVDRAVALSGQDVPVKTVVIGLDGEIAPAA
jgi:Pyruvate/2-oxoacid:ferredoxin oxidoreductase delta subunit